MVMLQRYMDRLTRAMDGTSNAPLEVGGMFDLGIREEGC